MRTDDDRIPESGDGPTVSVVMPVYDGASVLVRAVASVRAQTFPDWELIVVDDASGDTTLAEAKALASTDPRIRVLALDGNRGAGEARNHAIRAARGRYIAFLDADDAWMPDKLERQIGFMRETGAAFTYTGYLRGSDEEWRRMDVPDSVDYDTLLRGNVIGCLTVIYDSHVLGRAEMPDLRRRQDFALWLYLLRHTPRAYGLNEPLALYYCEPGRKTLSSDRFRSALATLRVYREREKLPLPLALWCLGRHLSRHLVRRPRYDKPTGTGTPGGR